MLLAPLMETVNDNANGNFFSNYVAPPSVLDWTLWHLQIDAYHVYWHLNVDSCYQCNFPLCDTSIIVSNILFHMKAILNGTSKVIVYVVEKCLLVLERT